MIPAKKVAKKMLKFFEKEKDRKILKQALKKRNAESIHNDYDKELDFSCQKRYGKIRETNLPREKSDILTEMKRRHNKYGRIEL